jgi:hypothetical protein
MGIGAAVAFIANPRAGRRRRARYSFDATARDIAPRASGIDDRQLLERVRAKLGRVVSHPRAIVAEVTDGHVRLEGAILSREVDGLLATVHAVPGVISVINELEAHESADSVPALRGEGSFAGSSMRVLRRRWGRGRGLVTAAGLAAMAIGAASLVRR